MTVGLLRVVQAGRAFGAGVSLALLPIIGHAPTLWAAELQAAQAVSVTATVLPATTEQKAAFLASHQKPSLGGFLKQETAKDQLALLVIAESALAGVFFYVSRHGYHAKSVPVIG